MWKFQDFSATQILREINFGHLDAPNTAILTIWPVLNLEFVRIFDISKSENFSKSKNSNPSKLLKRQFLNFWNQPKLISRKIRVVENC